VGQAQITLPSASTSGDLLVLSVVYDDITLSASVTDNKGNSYSPAVGPTTVGGWGEAYTFYAKNIVGGGSPVTATVTLTGTAPSLVDVFFLEYAGVETTAPLDQTNAGSGNGIAMDSGTRYLSAVPQLVYGFGADDGTCTADSPYTQRESTNGQCAMDLTIFNSGFNHVTATQNPTGNWLLQMATFKGA
jgi:hypothetical protein